jgi:hypothetical protein
MENRNRRIDMPEHYRWPHWNVEKRLEGKKKRCKPK